MYIYIYMNWLHFLLSELNCHKEFDVWLIKMFFVYGCELFEGSIRSAFAWSTLLKSEECIPDNVFHAWYASNFMTMKPSDPVTVWASTASCQPDALNSYDMFEWDSTEASWVSTYLGKERLGTVNQGAVGVCLSSRKLFSEWIVRTGTSSGRQETFYNRKTTKADNEGGKQSKKWGTRCCFHIFYLHLMFKEDSHFV